MTTLIGALFSSSTLSGLPVDLDVVLKLPHLGCAGGQDQVLIADCIGYIGRCQSLRLQRLCVQIYLHLALLTAIGVGDSRAFHSNQLRTKEVLSRSLSSCSESPRPDKASCRIGTLDALYAMTSGGVVPGGSCRN